MITTDNSADSPLHVQEDLEDLMELSSAFYWEQDADYRFTQSIGQQLQSTNIYSQSLIGYCRWDGGAEIISEGDSWEKHQADLEARRPFKGLLYRRRTTNGAMRYISSNGRPMFNNKGEFIGYRGIARDVTREQRAQHLLKLEHSVTRGLADADDITAALQVSIKTLCETEGYEAGQYWFLDEYRNCLRYYTGWHIDEDIIAQYGAQARNLEFEPGQGLIGRVFDSGEILCVSDMLNDPRVAQKKVIRDVGYKSAFLFPVTSGGQVIGVLDFITRMNIAAPDEGLLQVIRGLGAQIGQFYQRARSQQQLRDSEQRLISTFELAPVGIAHVAEKGHFIYVNTKLCEILGYTREELLQLTVREVSHPDDANITNEVRRQLHSGEIPSFTIEKRNIRKDGSSVWVSITITVKRDEYGNPLHDISVYEDIDARKQAEYVLRESEERFRALANLSSDWYWEMDDELRFCRLEGQISASGKDSEGKSALGKRPWETGMLLEDEGGWPAHQAMLKNRKSFRDVVMHRVTPDGKTYYFSISGEPVYDTDNKFKGYRGVGKDITERKQAEERIQYLATHDGLTGLPNRVMFTNVLNLAIQTCKRYKRKFAVLFIDLDRFKVINDTLGHEAGDILLMEMATRLKDCLRSSDVLARLGGDEFVVLLQEVEETERAANVARKMISTAMQPMDILGHECRVTASVGIAIYPQDAADEQSIMKNADIAMYLAKEQGKNNYQFYSKDIQALSHEKMALESGLRNAIDRQEFSLCYQAKRDLKSGGITGVEALLRWNSPTLGNVSPTQFIPLAEETGMIIPIGRWVLKTACAQNMAWQRAGLPPLCMAINLSPRQFNDHDLLRIIEETLLDTGMNPTLLELEITEGIVMHNPDHALSILQSIKNMGIRLAIDDFGTGYSSLAQLKRFPIDTLKVDRSFIHHLPTDEEDMAITEAIISMGKKLSLNIVAEGVETVEQEDYLRSQACNEMQGFYFSKPIPAADFQAMFSKHVAENNSAGR